MDYIEFVAKMKKYFKESGIKDKELAFLLGLDRSASTKKMGGKIIGKKRPTPMSIPELLIICDKLGVHPAYFFGEQSSLFNKYYKLLHEVIGVMESEDTGTKKTLEQSIHTFFEKISEKKENIELKYSLQN